MGSKVTAVLCNETDPRLPWVDTFSGIWELCGRAVYLQLVLYNNQLYYDALLKHDHESTRAGVDWEGRRSSDEGRGSLQVYLDTLVVAKLRY